MKCGIYKITNKFTKLSYIGQSIDIIQRWKSHISYADNNTYDYPLYKSIHKYGIESFTFEIIELCNKQDLNNREQYWINYYDTYNNGYNMTLLGLAELNNTGESHHNHKLLIADIIDIRTRYNSRERKYQVYKLYQDRIGKSGFNKIWQGLTWKDIMPEVYTEENKKFHAAQNGMKGQDNPRCKLSQEDINKIRLSRAQGYLAKEVYLQYKHLISKKYFNNIWAGINWN